MTAKEARQYQWQQLKGKPLTAKLKHIFTFYWPIILTCVFVIVLATSWIGNILSQKELVLSGYFLNSGVSESYEGDFGVEFLELLELDPEEYHFKITSNVSYSTDEMSETSMYVMESLAAQSAAGELDFFVVDAKTHPVFSSYYIDLRTVLTAEQQERWSPYFVYVEKDALEAWTSGSIGAEIVYPEYYTSAENMLDPIPLGIRLPETCKLLEAYLFPKGDVILSVAASVVNTENTLAFLEYILP